MSDKDQSLQLRDTPSHRVLNLFVGIEAILMKYVESNRDDKEAKKVLSDVRKCLEGNLSLLPKPQEEKPKTISSGLTKLPTINDGTGWWW